jgi:hypothetical protein
MVNAGPTRERSAAMATAAVSGSIVRHAPAYASHFSTTSGGTLASWSPRKSFTWLEKITTAMPLVNPVTTGCGMKRIALPIRVRPRITRRTPAVTSARNCTAV